jgi:hypothetical protein
MRSMPETVRSMELLGRTLRDWLDAGEQGTTQAQIVEPPGFAQRRFWQLLLDPLAQQAEMIVRRRPLDLARTDDNMKRKHGLGASASAQTTDRWR